MVDSVHLKEWIGRTESRNDVVTPVPAAALATTLDRDDPVPQPGDPLPPLWHWLYFLPSPRQSELGPDGHAKLGGFLPPVLLPRRMWAGSRFKFHHPLRIGDPITRHSRIVDIKHKQGRSGKLVFVQVRHEISNPQGLALTEEHDIVFRDSSAEHGPRRPPPSTPSGSASNPPRPRPAVPLLRVNVQRSSHPLRPPLCHRSRRLSRTCRARPAHRNSALRSPPPLTTRSTSDPFPSSAP